MSRVGKKPIQIPSGVKVLVSGQTVSVEGPKGKLSLDVKQPVFVVVEDNQVICKVADKASSLSGALYGLTRGLVANMISGCSIGFKKELEVVGVGYRANVNGRTLELQLGYSHPIAFAIPDGITITVDKQIKILVEGFDRKLVGQVASDIKHFRLPEPYKGKGVKYANERIIRKAGKAAGSGG